MPRGEYDRSKTKEQRAADRAKLKAAGKKGKAADKSSALTATGKGKPKKHSIRAAAIDKMEDLGSGEPDVTPMEEMVSGHELKASYKSPGQEISRMIGHTGRRVDFDLLGGHLSNLTVSAVALKDAHNPALVGAVDVEIAGTLKTMADLRKYHYGYLTEDQKISVSGQAVEGVEAALVSLPATKKTRGKKAEVHEEAAPVSPAGEVETVSVQAQAPAPAPVNHQAQAPAPAPLPEANSFNQAPAPFPPPAN